MSKHGLTSDTDLWKKFMEGDDQALSLLYKRHHDLLLMGLYKQTGDMEIAKNVLQEVFLQVLEEGSKNQTVRNFYTWMKIRLQRSWYKMYQKESTRSRIMREEVIPYQKDSVKQGHELDSHLIIKCIKMIKNRIYRSILLLMLEGYDNASIAKQINKEEGYIRRRKHEARNQLYDMLHKLGLVE